MDKPTPREQEKYAESPAYQPEEHPQMLICPRCNAKWAFYPGESFMSARSAEWCGWCERAAPDELQQIKDSLESTKGETA